MLFLATCADLPDGDPDTQRLAEHRTTLGIRVGVIGESALQAMGQALQRRIR